MKASVSGVPTAHWLGIKYQLMTGLDECPGTLRYSWFENPRLDHPHMVPGEWRWSGVRCLLGKPGSCTYRSSYLDHCFSPQPFSTLQPAPVSEAFLYTLTPWLCSTYPSSPCPCPVSNGPQAKAHGSLLYLQTQQRDTMNYSCYKNSRTNTIVWKMNTILPIPCKQLKCSSQRLGNSAGGNVCVLRTPAQVSSTQ